MYLRYVAFLQGLDFFGGAVRQLSPADWDRPSPCSGWRALDVLGHVGQATRFGTALLQGTRPDWSPVEPPGAVVEGGPEAWWTGLASQAADAVSGVDLTRQVDSPAGRRSIGAGLSFPALDLYIHGWDIARACGAELVIPAEAIEFAHAVIDPVPEDRVRNGLGLPRRQAGPGRCDPVPGLPGLDRPRPGLRPPGPDHSDDRPEPGRSLPLGHARRGVAGSLPPGVGRAADRQHPGRRLRLHPGRGDRPLRPATA